MQPRPYWSVSLVSLAAVAFTGVYLAFGLRPVPQQHLERVEWEIESVMVLNDLAATTYRLQLPYRVICGGQVIVNRRDEVDQTRLVIRLDLTIDGEHVTAFYRTDEQPAR